LLFWNAPSKSPLSVIPTQDARCFNPCCFGMRPRRIPRKFWAVDWTEVSILVVLECALEDLAIAPLEFLIAGFNPCCFGMRPRSNEGAVYELDMLMFQSLLFWNAPSKLKCSYPVSPICLFQSLLFWNAPSKSVLFKLMETVDLSFNPCCFGMRPRS